MPSRDKTNTLQERTAGSEAIRWWSCCASGCWRGGTDLLAIHNAEAVGAAGTALDEKVGIELEDTARRHGEEEEEEEDTLLHAL